MECSHNDIAETINHDFLLNLIEMLRYSKSQISGKILITRCVPRLDYKTPQMFFHVNEKYLTGDLHPFYTNTLFLNIIPKHLSIYFTSYLKSLNVSYHWVFLAVWLTQWYAIQFISLLSFLWKVCNILESFSFWQSRAATLFFYWHVLYDSNLF